MLSSSQAVPRIVIVGGGAGGLELATRLGRKLGRSRKAQVVLVDASPTHIWKPLLHEVATGALNTGEDEVNYFAHGYHNGYAFEYGTMTGLERATRRVQLGAITGTDGEVLSPARSIGYDYLVIAVGALTNDFGTPGVAEHAMFLNTPHDAERLRRRVLEQAFAVSAGVRAGQALRIVIIGGGATGVELAAELNHTVRELHQYGAALETGQVEISVVEGADRLLAAAPESLSAYAEQALGCRQIKVLTRSRVARVHESGVELSDGQQLPDDIVVWAAGVKAPDWLASFDGLAVNHLNQLKVDAQLCCENETRVYALGDCAAAPWGEAGQTLPATAQVAHQQAKWLAGALEARLAGREVAPFAFKPQGMMVSLGKHTAVGSLAAVVGPQRNYHVEGRGAKLIYASLYRMHQGVVHGWLLAALLYCGDKLRRVARPSLKLH